MCLLRFSSSVIFFAQQLQKYFTPLSSMRGAFYTYSVKILKYNDDDDDDYEHSEYEFVDKLVLKILCQLQITRKFHLFMDTLSMLLKILFLCILFNAFIKLICYIFMD